MNSNSQFSPPGNGENKQNLNQNQFPHVYPTSPPNYQDPNQALNFASTEIPHNPSIYAHNPLVSPPAAIANQPQRRRLYPESQANELQRPSSVPHPQFFTVQTPTENRVPQPNPPMPLYPKASFGSLSSVAEMPSGESGLQPPYHSNVYRPESLESLTNSFGNMGVNGQILQPLPATTTMVSMVGSPVVPQLIHAPPPAIRLNPQASCVPSPNSNCPPEFMRCTLGVIPNESSILAKCKIPLALYLAPFRNLEIGEPEIPLVDSQTIVRCRRCRTYINPFVQFLDKGQRWKCNLCYFPNEIPEGFDFDEKTQKYCDRWQKPELNYAVTEFVASAEYMLRPPQAPAFIFIIDVSRASIDSGMLATACQVISANIDYLHGSQDRALIAIITVNSQVQFYDFNEKNGPRMMVVGDMDDLFLPLPQDLFTNLSEAKALVKKLLDDLSEIHKDTSDLNCAIGPAMQAANQLMSKNGGKIIILLASRPNLYAGALKQKQIALPDKIESIEMHPELPFYKQFGVECSRLQISIDMFLFAPTPISSLDLVSMAPGSRYTSGNVYYYGPNWDARNPSDHQKFCNEFAHFLTRRLALEAVMRIRASQGIKMSVYHGNFFVRSSDLLAIPTVNPDNTYIVEMEITETLRTNAVCFQAALLHTTSQGERRIRVTTLALPVSSSLTDIYHSVDAGALAALISRKAINRALESSFVDAKDAVTNKCCEIFGGVRKAFHAGGSAAALSFGIPENLRMLPILALGIIKHPALRVSAASGSSPKLGPWLSHDLRAYYMELLRVGSMESVLYQLYPTIIPLSPQFLNEVALNESEEECNQAVASIIQQRIQVNATIQVLEKQGVYLIFNGVEIILLIARSVDPLILSVIFGSECYSYNLVPSGSWEPFFERLTVNQRRLIYLIQYLRRRALNLSTIWPAIKIVKEDSDTRLYQWTMSLLVEDRADHGPSYTQFVNFIREKAN